MTEVGSAASAPSSTRAAQRQHPFVFRRPSSHRLVHLLSNRFDEQRISEVKRSEEANARHYRRWPTCT